ncbi:hypothetical protein GCM10022223_18040 [Kineosporia mesophila]|uniref:Camelysin-like metallo-endopeptidase n=1 Tax=Kineosporia mesophila TaxID=566012 RepID=A0ABP6Z9X0_9ACTN|nr:hypothetical protein [Kineosporia mesophila]MCD5351959.1 hypothetical protein [Kineosporia mesophila]
MRIPPRTLRIWSVLSAVAIGAVIVFGLTVNSTGAAFSGSTGNGPNAFRSAVVTLTDDDTGSALFTVDNLYPGRTGSRCIRVSYTGSLPADVKMYVAPGDLSGSGLASTLKLTVVQGTSGSFSDCSGFSAETTLAGDETLSSIATHDGAANGLGSWSPDAGNVTARTRTYRFTYTLADDNTAQGKTAAVTFTWAATNS